MPATLTFTLTDICTPDQHGTFTVFMNGVEQFNRRVDVPAGNFEPLSGEEQKDLAMKLLRYAMQRSSFAPTGATQLANQLTGKGIELDLVTIP